MSAEARDPQRDFLRHALATLAYRAGKVIEGMPNGAGSFKAGPAARTPIEILSHISDLLDWTRWLAQGENKGQNTTPRTWDEEVSRFHEEAQALDAFLASDGLLVPPAEQLFQGPLADALTHVGQIAMLRGLAGAPIPGENFYKANIKAGGER